MCTTQSASSETDKGWSLHYWLEHPAHAVDSVPGTPLPAPGSLNRFDFSTPIPAPPADEPLLTLATVRDVPTADIAAPSVSAVGHRRTHSTSSTASGQSQSASVHPNSPDALCHQPGIHDLHEFWTWHHALLPWELRGPELGVQTVHCCTRGTVPTWEANPVGAVIRVSEAAPAGGFGLGPGILDGSAAKTGALAPTMDTKYWHVLCGILVHAAALSHAHFVAEHADVPVATDLCGPLDCPFPCQLCTVSASRDKLQLWLKNVTSGQGSPGLSTTTGGSSPQSPLTLARRSSTVILHSDGRLDELDAADGSNSPVPVNQRTASSPIGNQAVPSDFVCRRCCWRGDGCRSQMEDWLKRCLIHFTSKPPTTPTVSSDVGKSPPPGFQLVPRFVISTRSTEALLSKTKLQGATGHHRRQTSQGGGHVNPTSVAGIAARPVADSQPCHQRSDDRPAVAAPPELATTSMQHVRRPTDDGSASAVASRPLTEPHRNALLQSVTDPEGNAQPLGKAEGDGLDTHAREINKAAAAHNSASLFRLSRNAQPFVPASHASGAELAAPAAAHNSAAAGGAAHPPGVATPTKVAGGGDIKPSPSKLSSATLLDLQRQHAMEHDVDARPARSGVAGKDRSTIPPVGSMVVLDEDDDRATTSTAHTISAASFSSSLPSSATAILRRQTQPTKLALPDSSSATPTVLLGSQPPLATAFGTSTIRVGGTILVPLNQGPIARASVSHARMEGLNQADCEGPVSGRSGVGGRSVSSGASVTSNTASVDTFLSHSANQEPEASEFASAAGPIVPLAGGGPLVGARLMEYLHAVRKQERAERRARKAQTVVAVTDHHTAAAAAPTAAPGSWASVASGVKSTAPPLQPPPQPVVVSPIDELAALIAARSQITRQAAKLDSPAVVVTPSQQASTTVPAPAPPSWSEVAASVLAMSSKIMRSPPSGQASGENAAGAPPSPMPREVAPVRAAPSLSPENAGQSARGHRRQVSFDSRVRETDIENTTSYRPLDEANAVLTGPPGVNDATPHETVGAERSAPRCLPPLEGTATISPSKEKANVAASHRRSQTHYIGTDASCHAEDRDGGDTALSKAGSHSRTLSEGDASSGNSALRSTNSKKLQFASDATAPSVHRPLNYSFRQSDQRLLKNLSTQAKQQLDRVITLPADADWVAISDNTEDWFEDETAMAPPNAPSTRQPKKKRKPHRGSRGRTRLATNSTSDADGQAADGPKRPVGDDARADDESNSSTSSSDSDESVDAENQRSEAARPSRLEATIHATSSSPSSTSASPKQDAAAAGHKRTGSYASVLASSAVAKSSGPVSGQAAVVADRAGSAATGHRPRLSAGSSGSSQRRRESQNTPESLFSSKK